MNAAALLHTACRSDFLSRHKLYEEKKPCPFITAAESKSSDTALVEGRTMGVMRSPLPVKLFIGMLSPEPALLDRCTQILLAEYGPLDFESNVLPWDRTDYYREEMGPGIKRKFLFFEPLFDPGKLPSVKRFAVGLEKEFSLTRNDRIGRRINLDPGYVTEAKVVLSTTKDFSHRLYIGEDIYAEVTLRYSLREHRFTALEHTYPDYRSEEYLALFQKARKNLRAALGKQRSGGA